MTSGVPNETVARSSDGWSLVDDANKELGQFDWLVLTPPAAQSAVLAEAFPELIAYCRERNMLSCFALMLGFEEPLDLQWHAAHVRNADISWISVNSSKPARKRPFTLVVHSTNAWADAHLDDETELVLAHMLAETSQIIGEDLGGALHRQIHRWRYANIAAQSGPGFFLDDDSKIAACGDWCIRGRIEAAFTSASNLADSVAERLL